MNLSEYLQDAQPVVAVETYRPEGDQDNERAFDVELRLCTKADMETMRRRCIKPVQRKLPNGQWERTEETDVPKLRAFLADCIQGWTGLTFGKVAILGNLRTPNGDRASWVSKPVECTEDEKRKVFEIVLGFDDWVLKRVTELAEVRAAEEAREKNASPSTPAASTGP